MSAITLRVGEREISVSLYGAGSTFVALGHGAGSNRETPFLVRIAQALAASGRSVLLYNCPYSEAKRRVPDPAAVLEATVGVVAAEAHRRGASYLVLGGKSMGGRIASQAVAKGLAANALVFFGYPLHAPRKEGELRDRHLARIAAPMLFLQGTRDAFARWDLIEAVTHRLGARATLAKIEGADHGYNVLKASGLEPADVEALLLERTLRFLGRLGI